ncbi:AMP-binding protein [Psychrobacter sp. DAB_AL32B]|uniref:AMP-binding protein n=1 Tax=Psychrobacter sp. DAB_AL32B TaxID=1028414 RepID=UPI000B7F214A|nr:AMP-binding protein [Psychrobacter sp. DAB_AL32B]OXL18549.1 long-chain fatty acid--CoA ligase [Psychrobacter sp. DAB_AL32B]
MKKVWIENYPKGVVADVSATNQSLLELFESSFAKFSQDELITNMGVTYTYAQVDEVSKTVAAWIQSLGLKQGSVIVIMMPNVNQYLPIVIGAMRAGMVITLVNPLYTARELKHQLNDSDAKAIFILTPFCTTLEKIVGETGIKTVVCSDIGDMLGAVKGKIVDLAAKYVKKAVPTHTLKSNSQYKVHPYKSILRKGKGMRYTRPEISAKDIALLTYTGGTTGMAKGIIVSHHNVEIATSQYEAWFQPIYDGVTSKEQINTIVALPLYHIFAFVISMVGIRVGQHLTLITNPRDIDGFIKTLKSRPFHLLPAVNTLFQALMTHPQFKTIDFSAFKIAVAGGMAATPETARKWLEATGHPILEGWGMSETIGVGTANPFTNKEFNGSIGMPLPGVDINIRDEAGNVLQLGDVGELCIKGDNVISSYHNIDNAGFFTADGYLKTGDIGTMDDKGYVKIFDRKKDMIIVSGFNVYPNEVENVIETHPKVAECSVVGVDSESQGQSVKAYVVKSDSSVTEEEIKAFCKESLAGYKCPRDIEFITELPKSTVGKILRHELRKKANEAA